MFDLTLAMTALVSDHLTIRGGYTFLFLDGVALAADQLDTNPTMANSRDFIADKGTMTLQGPFIARNWPGSGASLGNRISVNSRTRFVMAGSTGRRSMLLAP